MDAEENEGTVPDQQNALDDTERNVMAHHT